MADLSKSQGYVGLAVFKDMKTRYDNYVATKAAEPGIVYIDSKKIDFVDNATFKDMTNRYNQYVAANKVEPSIVYFLPADQRTEPESPSRVIGTVQTKLEAGLGQFNNFTEFYNKCKGRGYSYYYNDVYTLDQEITRLINKTGLNCSDSSQLAAALATEMGYEWRYVHVMCQSGGHIRGQIKGKEFGDWTRIDMAACISVGSQYSIGQVWCDYDNAHIETTNWILVDDGV